ncbi:MAG: alr, partial [Caproiciproducens sp.]|nr:alr [Caproiciproducens sp.]
FSLEYAKKLNETLEKDGLTADVHIKLDTGMGRIGFFAEHQICEQAAKEISCLKSLHVTGVFSHFSHADCFSEDAKEYTNRQIKAFDECVKTIREYFPNIRTHLQNSAGIVDYNSLCYDIARPGIILYGLSPSGEMVNDIGLNPVMQMKSIVSMVKEIPAGTAVSYSRRFVSDKVMTVATVSVGYADGYSRLLSNRAEVLVKGKRAKVLGTVCMDQIIIDVTDIDGVAQGDIVTLFGKDGEQEISLDELANIIGTINYEIVCLMSKRVPRIYYKNNEIVATVDYIMS